ncbi:hypothetical protein ABPG72_020482 [Tetrahymena utriculariae]
MMRINNIKRIQALESKILKSNTKLKRQLFFQKYQLFFNQKHSKNQIIIVENFVKLTQSSQQKQFYFIINFQLVKLKTESNDVERSNKPQNLDYSGEQIAAINLSDFGQSGSNFQITMTI